MSLIEPPVVYVSNAGLMKRQGREAKPNSSMGISYSVNDITTKKMWRGVSDRRTMHQACNTVSMDKKIHQDNLKLARR
ncbi:MAG: hypothetical protein ACREBU_22785 [Nitrososphaera sp.]